MTGWVPDVLPGYWQCTIPLGPDPDGEGDIVATLVRRGPTENTTGRAHAVLAVHGYTDYFFHTELADHFAERGFTFYALDLRKCGRSRQDGQTPHFTTDLARYDAELERALAVIGEQVPVPEDPGVRPLRRRAHRVAVAGPAAPTRRDGRRGRRGPGAQQPVPGPARPRDPAGRP